MDAKGSALNPTKEKSGLIPPGSLLDVKEVGLRERHKVDKLRRITEAAESLFGLRGYDGTTLREIAAAAGIALGTLALYASDKRDLILLLVNKKIPRLMELGQARTTPNNTLVENITNYFEPAYQAFSKDVRLYRTILNYGNLTGRTTRNTREFIDNRIAMQKNLVEIIAQDCENSEYISNSDLNLQAKYFFFLYFSAVRHWIAGSEPSWEIGMAELNALFEIHVTGLKRHAELKAAAPE